MIQADVRLTNKKRGERCGDMLPKARAFGAASASWYYCIDVAWQIFATTKNLESPPQQHAPAVGECANVVIPHGLLQVRGMQELGNGQHVGPRVHERKQEAPGCIQLQLCGNIVKCQAPRSMTVLFLDMRALTTIACLRCRLVLYRKQYLRHNRIVQRYGREQRSLRGAVP
jgi:hypothetical protein